MRFVQLSDPHLVVPEKQPVLGHDTVARLRAAVDAVNRLRPAPDFVILTGDLTNDEQEASYTLVKSILSRLDMPLYPAVGNHDARLPFRRIILEEPDPKPDRVHYAFDRDGCRLAVLDTLDDGKVTGSIDDAQLDWLDTLLRDDPEPPTVVCCHHPPVPVGVAWMDHLMLQEADRLLRVLDRHPSVRWVLCGHVHSPFCIDRGRVTYFTAPSVSFQFRTEPLPPPAERPASLLSTDPPGFRVVDLRDGVFETSLHTIVPVQ
ncbi:MAG: phosphodiesterase [Candidatus Latescibacteria bacterium]|nr:phosphodiesterase [Candidatus Latescibacterota bacterium]